MEKVIINSYEDFEKLVGCGSANREMPYQHQAVL